MKGLCLRYVNLVCDGKITREAAAEKFAALRLSAERRGERDKLLKKFLDQETFSKDLDETLAVVLENNLGGALLFIDPDHLKEYNDTYGHGMGDRYIITCGGSILNSIRPEDLVGRKGGDEVAVFLPATDPEGAEIVAERIKQSVPRDVRFAQAEKSLPATAAIPTVSIGVSIVRPDITSAQLIKEADAAMYRAKEEGRDRVVVYREGMTMPERHPLPVEI